MGLAVSRLRQGQGVALVAVMVLVIVLFKVFDRSLAATIAGVLFLSLGAGLGASEIMVGRRVASSLFWLAEGFLTLFALPIFVGRLMNPGVPLEEVRLVFVTLADLHRLSNLAYLAMFVGWGIEIWRDRQD